MFTGKKKAACAAMLSMAMVAPLTGFAENETRVITCGTLNLRAEESASSKILGKYGWGSEVLVKGINGDWASVDVGGQSGYMYAKYLGREGTTNSTAYVKTNNRGLNLRAEPNGNILGSYPRGTKVTVLATTGEWSKVSVDGKIGYMQSRWLSGKAVSGDVTIKDDKFTLDGYGKFIGEDDANSEFTYTLEGDKLTLTNDSETIELTKAE